MISHLEPSAKKGRKGDEDIEKNCPEMPSITFLVALRLRIPIEIAMPITARSSNPGAPVDCEWISRGMI